MRGFLLILLLVPFTLLAQLPKPAAGQIRQFENFKSNLVAPRTIDVWLPDNYNPKTKYAVLYMHDGKGLYDSSIMWNKQEWKVDEVMSKLQREGKIRNCIVVGIYNSESTRHPEYFPQKPFESLSQIERDTITAQLQRMGRTKEVFKPISDNYLKFLVEELKPFIDKNFSTKTDVKNTFVAGSSMGGLISMYAICEYPSVFGGAACLSTHWPGTFKVEGNPIPEAFFRYMRSKLPDPKTHKLYFDYGDQTLDALYPPLQKRADEVIKSKGYTTKNWMTRFFPGENHSEKAWSKRLDIPFLFLLKK
ncbi:MAG: alpha/beta hydrolase [Bacteroidetes bacterium]|nr:alpha/beta hydrolase [Bacteroidota bacterium]